jgi:nitrite reductase/ring-hydroxylating ferredoxin subunit/DMSO/TMAO reductase YedYZ heme-binding membrane subunit
MLKNINHIFQILFLTILFLLSVFFIEFVRENVFYSLIGLLVIYLVVCWRARNKYDIYLILFLLAVFIASRLIFGDIDQATLTLRTSAILAFILINLALLIGPWSRFSDNILKLYHYRRHLGVTVFLLGALHVAIILPLYFDFSLKNAFASPFTFYGLAPFFIMLWIAITSWDYIQKKVKASDWKMIHATLMVIYGFISYYFYSVLKAFNDPNLSYHSIAILFFLIFWVIVAPYSIIKKVMKTYVFGWKQLHVLIWAVYFSLLLHVLTGAYLTANLFWKTIFWVLASLVLGSHIAGWIKRILEDKSIYSKIKSINKQFEERGKKFIGIAKASDFKEGKGKKFYVNKKPVAVFKNEGKFVAVSNVCCHQKGPIHQGKVQYGIVECPWHYWVYNLNDGKFIGKENYCLPVYETKVKDKIVFVGTEPINDRNCYKNN